MVPFQLPSLYLSQVEFESPLIQEKELNIALNVHLHGLLYVSIIMDSAVEIYKKHPIWSFSQTNVTPLYRRFEIKIYQNSKVSFI
jgi:hypothetical protein